MIWDGAGPTIGQTFNAVLFCNNEDEGFGGGPLLAAWRFPADLSSGSVCYTVSFFFHFCGSIFRRGYNRTLYISATWFVAA